MATTERQYYLDLLKLTVDPPNISDSDLKHLARLTPDQRAGSPYFKGEDFISYVDGYFSTQQLAVGEEVFPRVLGVQSVNNAVIATQVLSLTYFTARKTETVSNIASSTAGTAAAATPTLCRMGLYLIATDGGGTLVASCANDTALWAATFQRYAKALTVPYLKIAGQRYAFATLCVNAGATPALTCAGMTFGNSATMQASPKLAALKGSLSDLPASFTDASLSASPFMVYGEVF